jgi:hypothetical protein
LFAGSIELIPAKGDLTRVTDLLLSFVKTVKESVLDSLDMELAT